MEMVQERHFAQLMNEAQKGNNHSYQALLKELAHLLKFYFTRYIQQRELVDDLVQETLLSIHKARQTYDPEKKFYHWFYAIARYRLVDFFRKNHQNSKLEPLKHETIPIEKTKEGQERYESFQAAHAIMRHLPQKQRRVIFLLKLEELPVKDVATQMGMSEANVKMTASRAYKALKEIGEEGRCENRPIDRTTDARSETC